MAQMTQRQILLAFGANLPSSTGSPGETLRAALDLLNCDAFPRLATSAFYRNPAFPSGSGPDYVNAAALFRSAWSPDRILSHVHGVERDLGRDRGQRWTARSIDIDLIAVDDLVRPDPATVARWIGLPVDRQLIETPARLILPHPRLQDRAFVLVPASELWPDWRHPVTGRQLRDLRDALPQAERDAMQPINTTS